MGKLKPRLVLRVKDLESSINFYNQNFRWFLEWEDREKGLVQLRMPSGGATILTNAFNIDVKPFTDVAFVEPKSGQRFYLMGEKVDELKKGFDERLINNFELEVDPGFGQLIMLADPDGYIVSHWEELYMPDNEIISLYKSGPGSLEKSVEGLSEEQLNLVRAEGKWSIRQTALHLIDSDLTMFHRIKFALAESGREYRQNPYDPNQWELGTEYSKRTVHTEVSLFRLLREHVINLIEHLPHALDRTIKTEDQGELTVRKMIKMVAGHAKGHFEQIEETRIVNKI